MLCSFRGTGTRQRQNPDAQEVDASNRASRTDICFARFTCLRRFDRKP